MGPRRIVAIAVLASSAIVTVAGPASAVVPDYWDLCDQAPGYWEQRD